VRKKGNYYGLSTRKGPGTNKYRYQLQTRERILVTQKWFKFHLATNQRTKKPAIKDNTIADTPPLVEVAPFLVEVAEGAELGCAEDGDVVTGLPVVCAELEDAVIVSEPKIIVFPVPIIVIPLVVFPAPLIVVPVVAGVEEVPAAVDAPEAAADVEIERILVVVGAEVGVRVALPEAHNSL